MIKIRVLIVILCFGATMIDILTRNNLNVAIVSMVTPPNTTNADNASQPQVCFGGKNSTTPPTLFNHFALKVIEEPLKPLELTENPRYDWSQQFQGIVLGAFYALYIVMQVPTARIAETIGGYVIVLVTIIGSSAVNIATPFVAQSQILFLSSRLLLGLIQSGLWAACYAIVTSWTASDERSLSFAITDLGGNVGSITGAALSGYLADIYGWPIVFYVSGIIALCYAIIWSLFASSTPQQSKLISQEELDFLRNHEQETQPLIASSSSQRTVAKEVPWFKIFTCPAVIALIVSKLVFSFGGSLTGAKLPSFYNDVLNISLTAVVT